ncbi:hypothetical protein ACTMU2_23285 [Cupriavidus basilensis]
MQLPDMGDPFTSGSAAARHGKAPSSGRIIRDIRRDPQYAPDPLLSDYLNALGYRLVQGCFRRQEHLRVDWCRDLRHRLRPVCRA